MSHPTWVRGLKPEDTVDEHEWQESHPTWVRGLKLKFMQSTKKIWLSHPTWVRGLKLWAMPKNALGRAVAPYVGAWIETTRLPKILQTKSSHPTWVRGLKLSLRFPLGRSACRTLRGCVD